MGFGVSSLNPPDTPIASPIADETTTGTAVKSGFGISALGGSGPTEQAPTPGLRKPPKEQGDFSRGLSNFGSQTTQIVPALKAFAGAAVGSDKLRDEGLADFQKIDAKISANSKASDSFTDAWNSENDGDFIDYLQYGAGQLTGNILAAVATGGVGSIGGKFLFDKVARSGLQKATAAAVEKQVAAGVAREAAVKATYRSVGVGAALGAFSFGQEIGQIYPTAFEEASAKGEEVDLLRVFGAAVLAATIDASVDKLTLGSAGKVLSGAKTSSAGAATRIAKEAFVTGLREGGTELAQTGIERWGASQELTSPEAIKDYVDSAALGILGGGAIGGVTGALTKPPKPAAPAVDTPPPPPPAEPVAPGAQPLQVGTGIEVTDELRTKFADDLAARGVDPLSPAADTVIRNLEGIERTTGVIRRRFAEEERALRQSEISEAFGQTATSGVGIGVGGADTILQRGAIEPNDADRTIEGDLTQRVKLPETSWNDESVSTEAVSGEDIVARQQDWEVSRPFEVRDWMGKTGPVGNRFVSEAQAISLVNHWAPRTGETQFQIRAAKRTKAEGGGTYFFIEERPLPPGAPVALDSKGTEIPLKQPKDNGVPILKGEPAATTEAAPDAATEAAAPPVAKEPAPAEAAKVDGVDTSAPPVQKTAKTEQVKKARKPKVEPPPETSAQRWTRTVTADRRAAVFRAFPEYVVRDEAKDISDLTARGRRIAATGWDKLDPKVQERLDAYFNPKEEVDTTPKPEDNAKNEAATKPASKPAASKAAAAPAAVPVGTESDAGPRGTYSLDDSDRAYVAKADESLKQSVKPNPGITAVESLDGVPPHRRKEFAVAVELARKLFTKRVVIVDQKNPFFNGMASRSNNDYILLYSQGNAPVMQVLGHELLHMLRTRDEDAYATLKGAIRSALRTGAVKEYQEDLQKIYDQAGFKKTATLDVAAEELLADLLGNRFLEPKFWEMVANHSTESQFQKIVSAVTNLLSRLAGMLDGAAMKESDVYIKDMDKVRDVLAEMVANWSQSETYGSYPEGGPDDVLPSPSRRKPSGDLFTESLKPGKTEMSMNWVITNPTEARGILDLPEFRDQRSITKRDFGEAIDEWRKGKVARNDYGAAAVRKLATALANEVEWYAGYAKDSGVDWYSKKFQRAIDKLVAAEPSLKKAENRGLFTLLLAITSDGTEVQDNLNFTMAMYKGFLDGKPLVEVTPGQGKYESSYQKNAEMVDAMIAKHGLKRTLAILLEPKRAADIKVEMAAIGVKSPASDYPDDAVLPRAAVYLGPKLGAFYANLMGETGYLTMDRWWNRTINRYRGYMATSPTESSLTEFRELIDRPRLTEERLLEIAREMAAARQKKYEAARKAGSYYEPTKVETIATTIDKNARTELNDSPINRDDRAFQIKVAKAAQAQLKERGLDLAVADIQATIWYYEKELFAAIGVKGRGRISYEEAANRWVREYGRSSARGAGRDDARAEVADARPGPQQDDLFASPIGGGDGDGGGRPASGRFAPLEGAPSVPGYAGPDPRIVEVAERYARDNGITLRRQGEYVDVDPARAARIAFAYAEMRHAPQDPVVREAYDNLIRQTTDQYRALERAGYKFWFIDTRTPSNAEYADSPWNAMRDMRANQQMGVFPTSDGFGSSDADVGDNPLLADTGIKWPVGGLDGKPQPVLANDLFRAVHDALGHGMEGAGFRARGEENAWQAHARLFTGSALGAVTSETRGQNSWLNYGPNGEANRNAKVEDTVFADQKTGLMPEWTWSEGRDDADFLPSPINRPGWDEQTTKALNDPFTPPVGKTIGQRLEGLRPNFLKRFTIAAVDPYIALKELDPNLYMRARLTKGIDGGLEALMQAGEIYDNGGALDVKPSTKGLIEALRPLGAEVEDFFRWVALNRASELKKQDRENFFTDASISLRGKLVEGRMPDGRNRLTVYSAALKDMNALNRSVLQLSLKQGLIDQAGYDRFSKDMWYVPFYRIAEETDNDVTAFSTASGLTNQDFGKRLKGGTDQVAGLLPNLLRNWGSLLSAAQKNGVAVDTLQQAVGMGAATRSPSGAKGSVTVMVSGRPQSFLVSEPFLLDALLSINTAALNHPILKVLTSFKRLLTGAVTFDPAYKLRNIIRDSIQSIALADLSKNPFANVAQGMAALRTEQKASALAGGGLFHGQFSGEDDMGRAIKRLAGKGVSPQTVLTDPKSVATTLLQWYGDKGDQLENANRMALYVQTRAAGGSHLEAAFAARDLMDFSLQGRSTAVRMLAQTLPFFNSRLQGLYKLGRDGVAPTLMTIMGKADEGQRVKAARFATVAGAVTLASLALYLTYKDDEEFKKREPWDRDGFWWFKVGDTAYRIPKPFEIGALATIAERGLEQMIDDDVGGETFAKAVSDMLTGTFAFDPIPQAFRPLISLIGNKDPFTGRTIETLGLQQLPKVERANAGTSAGAKLLSETNQAIADAVGPIGKGKVLSPVQIDYLARGYFGWVGSTTMQATTAVANWGDDNEAPSMRFDQKVSLFSLGALSGFVKDLPANQSRYVNEFYTSSEEIGQMWADIRHQQKLGRLDKARELMAENPEAVQLHSVYSSAQRQISTLNQQMRRIEVSPELDGDQKREALDTLSQRKSQIAQRVETIKRERRAALAG